MRDRYAMAQLFSSIPTPAMRNLSIWTIKWSACYATASDASLELAESISNASNATAIMVAVRHHSLINIHDVSTFHVTPPPLYGVPRKCVPAVAPLSTADGASAVIVNMFSVLQRLVRWTIYVGTDFGLPL